MAAQSGDWRAIATLIGGAGTSVQKAIQGIAKQAGALQNSVGEAGGYLARAFTAMGKNSIDAAAKTNQAALKATKNTKTLKEKLGNVVRGTAKATVEIYKGAAKVIGVAAPVIASGIISVGKATSKMLSSTMDYAGEIDEMAVRTGISREELQKLKYVAGQVGVEFGSVQSAITNLGKNMATTTQEGKAAEKGLAALGISARDSNGDLRDQHTVFQEAVAMLSTIENKTQRAALAQEVFGDQATGLAPLFDAGTDSLSAMAREAESLGIVMSEQDIVDTAAMEGKFNKIKDTTAGFGRGLINALMPAIGGVTDMVIGKLPEIQQMMQGLFSQIGPMVMGLLPQLFSLADALMPLVDLFFNLAAQAGPMLFDVMGKVLEALKPVIPVLIEAAQQIMPLIMQVMQLAFMAILPLIDAISPLIGLLLPTLIQLFGMLMPLMAYLQPVVEILAQVFQGVLFLAISAVMPYIQILSDALAGVLGFIMGIIDFVKNVFVQDWTAALKGISDVFVNLAGDIVKVGKGIGNIFSNIFGLGSAEGGEGGASASTQGTGRLSGNKMAAFAQGGIATRPSIFGEAGPEMAIPLQRTPRSLSLLSETAQRLGVGGGGSSPTFVYSPTISGGNTAENRQLLSESQADFEARMDRWWREKGRPAYGL